MVVAFTIVATLKCNKQSALASQSSYIEIRIERLRLWLCSFSSLQLVDILHQHQFSSQCREITAVGIKIGRIIPEITLFSDESGKSCHFLVTYELCKRKENIELYNTLVAVRICKGYDIIVAYIHIIYICPHTSHLVPLVVQHRDVCHLIALDEVEQVQAFKIACRSPVPIACSLVAATIVRIAVYELLHTVFYLHHSPLHAHFITFVEIQTCKPVGTYPGIPVHTCRLPPIAAAQNWFEHSVVYLLADLSRQCRTNLGQRTLQTTTCPCQQCC